MKKIVLAFSGGLDTSYCAIYLSKDLGFEVHTLTVNTGGFSESETKDIERRAMSLGVKSHKTVDETKNYYDKVIRFLIYGNVLKNATYPLSVSAERMSQALAAANYAREIKADAVAHGSTGAGNDQVRFDMVIQILAPGLEIKSRGRGCLFKGTWRKLQRREGKILHQQRNLGHVGRRKRNIELTGYVAGGGLANTRHKKWKRRGQPGL
jgi:argininosuccinate synthase